ncbi:putative transmembrane domain-containing protein [Cryptosporidium canis]|nr:putative transmembrane domain-containing protein [Cryptosporidium canis]
MILSIEQVIGYFDSNSDIDIRSVVDDDKKDVGNINFSHEKFYGNEIKLFDDLHIASIINNNKIFIYNISKALFPWRCADEQFRSSTITSIFNLSLPFTPTCNCGLFFDKDTSILTISVSSNKGILHFITILVSGKYEYSLSIQSTRTLNTDLPDLKFITPLTNTLLFINSESGFFGAILCNKTTTGDFSPLFSIEDLSTKVLDVSAFLIVKRVVINRDTEHIYLITFSQKNKDLSLLLVVINLSKKSVCVTFIDRASGFPTMDGFVNNPILSLVNDTDVFLILINNTIYLYRIVNLEDFSSKKEMNLKYVRHFDLRFEQNKEDRSVFSTQIFCSKSDIYVARVVIPDNACSYDTYLPVYEVQKICLEDSISNTTMNTDNMDDPEIIWSQGAQMVYYDGIDYDKLKFRMGLSNVEFSDVDNLTSSIFSIIFKECPSKIVLDMAFLRYLKLLKNIILLNFKAEPQKKLLDALNSTNRIEGLAVLIRTIYLNFEDQLIESSFEGHCENKFDREKIFCLVAPFILFINYFKAIGSCCIRIFSNRDEIFILSPISISTISNLSEWGFNGISLNPYKKYSSFYLPFDIIGHYLEFKYILWTFMCKVKNCSVKRHILDLFDLYSRRGVECKAIVLSIIMELSELLSNKIKFLNKINCIYPQKSDLLYDISMMHYDAWMQQFTPDQFNDIIQDINESIIYISLRNGDFVLSFAEKTLKANLSSDFHQLSDRDFCYNRDMETSNLEFTELIKIKNVIFILDIYLNTTKGVLKYFIWKQITQSANSGRSCGFELTSKLFYEEVSFLNVGKYMTSCKPGLIYYNGMLENNFLSVNCERGPDHILLIDQIYKIYKYYSSICKFFASDFFFDSTAKLLSTYIRSSSLFWESFLDDFCYKFAKYEENIQQVDLIYDYIEDHIFNGCLSHNLARYIFHLIKLIPYKKNTSHLSHLILNKFLSDIHLVDEVIELIKPEVNEDQLFMIKGLSSRNNKIIYFVSLVFKLFDQSINRVYYNSIYINLLEISINIFCTPIIDCSPNQKMLINHMHRKYLIQYIYLEDNISYEKMANLINKSLVCCDSKYEKMLFLTTLWVKHYLSIKARYDGEGFHAISSAISGFDADEFYSLLIKIFWKKLKQFRKINIAASSELPQTVIFITQAIYNFFLNNWKKEKRHQEIFTLAYINSLARYHELISSTDRMEIVFPYNWYEFICRYESQEMDSLHIFGEVFESLRGLFNYMNFNHQITNVSESLNVIISSLNTYSIYSKIHISKESSNQRHAGNSICIPNFFFDIELPIMDFREKCTLETNLTVTYLPSPAYISYLKWYLIGVRRLFIQSSLGIELYQYFNHYGKYLDNYKFYLEQNGVYFKSVFNLQLPGSENLANFLSISMNEVIYYLILHGHFETSYRLIEVASQFLEAYDQVLPLNGGLVALSNPLLKARSESMYKTIGFWLFTYCLYLSNNTNYLNSLIDCDGFLLKTKGGMKKHSFDSSGLKITTLENIVLKSIMHRNSSISNGVDYSSFDANVNFWNLLLGRLGDSPYFLHGVFISILISRTFYSTDGSIGSTFISSLPNELLRIYNDPEYLVNVVRGYPISNNSKLNVFMKVIEDLINFNFIEDTLMLITVLNNQVELPIYFIAKIRYMIRLFDKINESNFSKKLESIMLQ